MAKPSDSEPTEEPAAEGDAQAAEGEATAGKSKKKKLIIMAVLAVVLLGGGVGAFMMMKGKSAHQDEAAHEGEEIAKPVFYTLPEVLVNLNSGGKQASFLKATVIIELTKQTDVASVEANLPRLQDAINTYLRELRASDLAGSAGIQRLREELLLRSEKALAPVKINDVLFKEIIVQ